MPGPRLASRKRDQAPFQLSPSGRWIAGEVLAVGELELPSRQRHDVAGWRQLQGEFFELDHGFGGASGPCRLRCAVQCRRDLLVRAGRCKGQMPGSLLRAGTSFRRLMVNPAAVRLGQGRVERGSEEGMGKVHQAVRQHMHHPSPLGRRERGHIEDGRRWTRHHRDLRQHVARRLGQAPKPEQGHVSLVWRNRQWPPGRGRTHSLKLRATSNA